MIIVVVGVPLLVSADSGVHGPLGLWFLLFLRHGGCGCDCVCLTDGREKERVVVVVVVVCWNRKEVVSSLASLENCRGESIRVVDESQRASQEGISKRSAGRKSWARGQVDDGGGGGGSEVWDWIGSRRWMGSGPQSRATRV